MTSGFSVLMSIYSKENARYFDRAMTSIWDDQTVKPSEIVLVEDGMLTEKLYSSISQWKDKIGSNFRIIPLKKNCGLGVALNIGLKECGYDLIARMDTDDISRFDRFEKQLSIFTNTNIDVCSSWMSEFDKNELDIISYKILPKKHLDIVSFSKKRNPVNHPAVMFKKSSVLEAGGYKHMPWFEDYYLWIRMILNSSKFFNIQEPLVNMRVGLDQIRRRSGFGYALSEVKFQKFLLSKGFTNNWYFYGVGLVKFLFRISPKFIITFVYRQLRSLV
jgi:glycosyltransferase involved in cell wall biosynthesis